MGDVCYYPNLHIPMCGCGCVHLCMRDGGCGCHCLVGTTKLRVLG